MIAIRTTSDWTTATVDFTDGVTPLTWTPSASVHDARAAADDLAAWLLAQYGVIMVWTWDRFSTGVSQVDISTDGSFEWMASAAAQTLLGFDPAIGSGHGWDWFDAVGVLVPRRAATDDGAYIGNWEQSRPGMMPGTAQGAISAQPPGTSSYRPIIRWTAIDYEVATLRNALAVASNPRTAAIYDVDAAVWRDVSFGAVTIRSAPAHHSVSLEALG
jgi:hypothetical protein